MLKLNTIPMYDINMIYLKCHLKNDVKRCYYASYYNYIIVLSYLYFYMRYYRYIFNFLIVLILIYI